MQIKVVTGKVVIEEVVIEKDAKFAATRTLGNPELAIQYLLYAILSSQSVMGNQFGVDATHGM